MIVQNEDSNGSYSRHSASQLDLMPSSQAPKQSYYKQQWKRKGNTESAHVEPSAKSRAVPRLNSSKVKAIVLMELSMMNEKPIGAAIKAEFQTHEESPTDETFQIRGFVQNLTSKNANIIDNHMIRWTKSLLHSCYGADLTLENVSTFEPFALCIADCEMFLERMLLSEDGLEFAHLGAHVMSLFAQLCNATGASAFMPEEVSMIVALLDLDKTALKVQRKVR